MSVAPHGPGPRGSVAYLPGPAPINSNGWNSNHAHLIGLYGIGFIMVYHGFIMVYHDGLSWFYHGLSWFYHGLSLFYHGLSWFIPIIL